MAGGEPGPPEFAHEGEPGPGSVIRAYILVPVVLVLLPMMIEFGCMINATVCLKRAAAEAGAAAANGAAPSVIEARIDAYRGGIDGRFVDCRALCSGWDPEVQEWSAWSDLRPAGAGNCASPGDRIRVRLDYEYGLVLGGLLAPLFGAGSGNTVDLEAVVHRIKS